MIPYLGRLLDITIKNGTLPADWKRAMVVPVHKCGDRSLVTNYRPVSLSSVACKQMEHVIASYLRQGWDKCGWLHEGQHGFRLGYSCESQVIMVCQDIADSLDNGDWIVAFIIDFSKYSDLVPHGWLLTKIANMGVDSTVVVWIREFLLGRMQSQDRRAIIRGIQSNVRCTRRERFRSSNVPSLRTRYFEEY